MLFCLRILVCCLAFTHTATVTNAPLGVCTFFGGVVAGVVSVLLFVWLVVRLGRRMKEPAVTEEKKGFRYVSKITT